MTEDPVYGVRLFVPGTAATLIAALGEAGRWAWAVAQTGVDAAESAS